MKTAIITIFLFFVHLTLFAQQKEAVFRVGGGYVFAGTDFIHTASLDRSLRQYHLPEFGGARNATTFGAGGGVFINRFSTGEREQDRSDCQLLMTITTPKYMVVADQFMWDM